MFPHRAGSAWEVFAPAKLNLYLDVLGLRTDGFHELETLLVPVRLYDQLRWTAATEFSLQIRSQLPPDGALGSPSDNLVQRAAQHLAEAAGIQPHGSFELVKRIPVQAGLGGGSSDAAAALLLANEAWKIGYSRARLAELAADLGSDVPFFLQGTAAIGRGRGEILQPTTGLPRMHFVVVKPPVSLSTAEVFARCMPSEQIEPGRIEKLIGALRRGALSEAGGWMFNRLGTAAVTITTWMDRVIAALSEQGCRGCLMTGSGSACFGLLRTAREARRVAGVLSGKDLGNVLAVASC